MTGFSFSSSFSESLEGISSSLGINLSNLNGIDKDVLKETNADTRNLKYSDGIINAKNNVGGKMANIKSITEKSNDDRLNSRKRKHASSNEPDKMNSSNSEAEESNLKNGDNSHSGSTFGIGYDLKNGKLFSLAIKKSNLNSINSLSTSGINDNFSSYNNLTSIIASYSFKL
jgi:hypothetical protein